MSSGEDGGGQGRLAPWIGLMVAVTLWYAWPQFFYSLFIGYDFLRTFLPEWASRLEPLVDLIVR